MANAARVHAAPLATAPFAGLDPWARGTTGRSSPVTASSVSPRLPDGERGPRLRRPSVLPVATAASPASRGRRAPVEKGGWDASRGIEDGPRLHARAGSRPVRRVLKPTGIALGLRHAARHLLRRLRDAVARLPPAQHRHLVQAERQPEPLLPLLHPLHRDPDLGRARRRPGSCRTRFDYPAMKAANGGKQMRDVWALPRSGEEELADDGEGRVWTSTSPRAGRRRRSAVTPRRSRWRCSDASSRRPLRRMAWCSTPSRAVAPPASPRSASVAASSASSATRNGWPWPAPASTPSPTGRPFRPPAASARARAPAPGLAESADASGPSPARLLSSFLRSSGSSSDRANRGV